MEEAAMQYSFGGHGTADCQLPDSTIYNAVPWMWDRVNVSVSVAVNDTEYSTGHVLYYRIFVHMTRLLYSFVYVN